jgi:Na+-translocating ferredoxin:NAD+ oxidoreductase RnfA subunit
MTEYLIGAVAAALVNCWTLARSESAGTMERLKRAGCLGGVTVLVTLKTAGLSYILYYGVLSPLGMGAARVPLCFLAAFACAWASGQLARNGAGVWAEFVETHWALAALNAAVLGASLHGVSGVGFTGTLLSAFTASAAFALSLLSLTAIRARLDVDALPECVRGFPALLLAAALISMALTAFAGL